MTTFCKEIHDIKTRLEQCRRHFVCAHRFLAFLVVFMGLPVLVLASVAAGAALIALPFAWIFGWL